MEKRIVIATGNAHKVEEFNRLARFFALPKVRFVSAKEALPSQGMPPVEENAGTFCGNARLKAEVLRKLVPAGDFVLADDSGLCVDFLGGAPGVDTAYYAGRNATSEQNRAKLLAALAGVPAQNRGAHFVCTLLLISPTNGGGEFVFEGKVFGAIAEAESGSQGFGYDPIFVPAGFSQTFAEIEGEKKDALSHRGRAFAKLAAFLKKQK